MATSFISEDYVEGFWVQDELMQVVCWGIVSVIDKLDAAKGVWPNNGFRDYIYDNSQGIFVGFMNLSLEEYLINQNARLCFLKILKDTKSLFLAKGPVLNTYELNAFQLVKETKREWVKPLKVDLVIEVLNSLELLIGSKSAPRSGAGL